MNLFPSQQTSQIDVSIFPLTGDGCAGMSRQKEFCKFTSERNTLVFIFESTLTCFLVEISLIQLADPSWICIWVLRIQRLMGIRLCPHRALSMGKGRNKYWVLGRLDNLPKARWWRSLFFYLKVLTIHLTPTIMIFTHCILLLRTEF